MTHRRRDFLRQVSGVALGSASWSTLSGTAHTVGLAVASPREDEEYWQLLRQQFPLEDGLTYLNAANICPASRPVLDRQVAYIADFHKNPSFQNREKYKPMYERLRGKLASVLHASSADEIAITRNTSEGNNLIVNGLDFAPGDEIVISDHNHQSNSVAWEMRAKRDSLVVKRAPVSVPAESREALIAGFERLITPRTKVVALTHVTATTGVLFPVREIAELARRQNAWVHVDGAQTFGVLAVDVQALGCDSYSASSHKWMMGPLEAGVLYVHSRRLAELWPPIVTAGWADDLKGARRLDVVGQREDPRVVAFEAAIDFMHVIGIDKVEARSLALAARAKRLLADLPAVRMKSPVSPELSGPVVKFSLRNRPTKEAYDTLWQKHRIALAITAAGEAEGLRCSPHIYNSFDDIDRLVAGVRELG
ncbi:Isopenicillin N epimerase [Luteitalea pratensis]|uniref:Isopenicillin N epimerase n=1 Tax=Luteitalea pratensis TaxID=1855912 RepID=A0A143PI32_LUTPR|nr:aminotransferase class V-fold PLP-dependent enzyme [Luteitalea pratensis]AMY07920.1 Isopenicillin N epimerase [Luteitalea pratensis]